MQKPGREYLAVLHLMKHPRRGLIQTDPHAEATIHFRKTADQETMWFDNQQVQMVHKAFTSADRNNSVSWEKSYWVDLPIQSKFK